MADAPIFEVRPDGMVVLDHAVELPPVLDAVIVGGGPFGTALAFRLKELGRTALVIDYDDLMKRIRDYAKDKQILPDYGGGDRMQFPKGGDLIRRLVFEPIDKDAMCVAWKSLYRQCDIPAQIGVEMTGLERAGDLWEVVAWNHNLKREQRIRTHHVALAFGRGVPRRFDIPGKVEGLAFGLTTASRYVGEPALVIGGGTSAAEAVIAISSAKSQGGDTTDVYWSYRGEKMPKVSRALADPFFEAFVSNGNVRYLPTSEPVAVLEVAEESYLSVRTNRIVATGCPPETTQLEFRKAFCIACIGEDIPEGMLSKIGIPLVTGGAANKKRIVVSPLLETRQPNVYLAGDVLSPAYFETTEFDDPSTFKEVKRRGNIKAAMRDGVMVAEVIDQKLAGKTLIEVHLEFEDDQAGAVAAEPAAVEAPVAPVPAVAQVPPSDSARHILQPTAYGDATVLAPRRRLSRYRLVSILQSGVEANEFPIKTDGPTTIGRQGSDVAFPEDLQLSDIHASIVPGPEGYRVRDEGSAEGVYVRPVEGRLVTVDPGTIIRVGRQWLVVGDDPTRPSLMQYDASGQLIGRHDLKQGTTILGRQSPDITIAPDDSSISRRHFATIIQGLAIAIKDLGSGNGTYVKVGRPMMLAHGDQLHLGRQVLQFTDEALTASPSSDVAVKTGFGRAPAPEPAAPAAVVAAAAPAPRAPAAPPPARPAAAAPAARPATPPGPPAAPAKSAPAAAPAAGEPAVTFEGLKKQVTCSKGQTICEAAEHGGIKMDADCHAGVCGMDPVKVIAGAEHLGPMSSTEKGTLEDLCSLEPGPYRLACMARVSGPVVVDIVKQ